MFRKLLNQIIQWLRPEEKTQKNQWVAISICAVLAVTLWFLVTLNIQTFQSSFKVPLKVDNLPEKYQLKEDLPSHVTVQTEGKGIALLSRHFSASPDTVEVDFSLFQSRGQFVASNNLQTVNRAFPPGISSLKVMPDSLSLEYVLKSYKMVPVELDLKPNFPVGYRHFGSLIPRPDSVLIVGPEEDLAGITRWRTESRTTRRINSPTTVYVKPESRRPFQINPGVLKVDVDPVQFTERSLRIPVQAVNLPADTKLRVEPDSATASFLIPLANYEAIAQSNVHLEVDFTQLNSRSSYVLPKMVGMPETAVLQSFEPHLMRYLVITER